MHSFVEVWRPMKFKCFIGIFAYVIESIVYTLLVNCLITLYHI